MGEQMAEGDLPGIRGGGAQRLQLGQIKRGRVIQAQFAGVAELEYGHGRETLAHRGGAKECPRISRPPLSKIGIAKAAGEQQLSVVNDTIGEARQFPACEMFPEDMVHDPGRGPDFFRPVRILRGRILKKARQPGGDEKDDEITLPAGH